MDCGRGRRGFDKRRFVHGRGRRGFDNRRFAHGQLNVWMSMVTFEMSIDLKVGGDAQTIEFHVFFLVVEF